MDFMLFTGLETEVPDETTLCRFRNRLIERDLDKELLDEINEQLEKNELKVESCAGAVINATIIRSVARPNKIIDIETEDRKEEETKKDDANIEYSKDKDARWLKKGGKYYLGYKGFIATDSEDGYIEAVHIRPANDSEIKHMDKIIPTRKKPKRLYGDKGYASQNNRDILKERKIKDGIMSKAQRGKPLKHWEKIRNKLISSKRFIVEQGFGTLKRRFKFERASYFTKRKVEAQFIWKAMCFNLLKGYNKAVWI